MAATPSVTVVVPTRNRAEALGRLLRALAAQSLPAEEIEIVIVDDASTDGSAAVLAEHGGRAGGRFRVLRHAAQRGPAAARNSGWREASAPIVAFTDDDCQPKAGWLAAGLARFAADPGLGLVMGRTEAEASAEALRAPFSRSVVLRDENPGYPTCNMFYPRAVLEAVGGFDESFRLPCGEDMDIAWRVKESGRRSAFAADAIVVHDVDPPDYRRFLRDRVRWTEHVHVLARHPDLRRFYTLGYFMRRSHLHVAASLLVLPIAALLSGWAAWLLLPLWLDRFRPLRTSQTLGPRAIAGWIFADFWEFAHFAAASFRYRTLLL